MSRSRSAAAVVVCAALVTACGGSGRNAAPSSTATPTVPPPTRPVTTIPTSTTRVAAPPYPVTEITLKLVDTSRPTVSHGRPISASRALTTLVWMPARSGRWPLVVFAHGYQVGPTPYTTLLEAWAAHGYVVAAPEFPLTDVDVAGADLDENDIENQPQDVRYVTDYLVSAGSPVADRIDPAKVGVAGHSDGAETALAAGTDPTPAGEPAYRAIIAFGVQPVPGAAGHNPPILVGQGDQDQINPPSNGYTTFDQAAAPKYLLVMKGAGHLPPLEAGSQWLLGIAAVTDAFLDAYVADDGAITAVTAAARPYPQLALHAG